MKKNIIILGLISLLAVSCGDDFLTTHPGDSVSTDLALSTEQDIDEYEREISGYMKEASELFLNRVYAEGCDILDVYGRCKRKFSTLEGYEEYDVKSKKIEFNAEPTVTIRRSGNIAREADI